MATIFSVKEQQIADTPLLLFECKLSTGEVERWSTHAVTINGELFAPRVARHSVFEFQLASDQGIDAIPKVSVDLANADGHFSELERNIGFRGAKLTVSFVFYDLKSGRPSTETAILFQGIVNSPDLITESGLRLSAINRLSAQRLVIPPIRVQRRCAWDFPTTHDQRLEAVSGAANGRYSRFYGCGYSPDIDGGVGNLNGGVPFTSCDFTRSACEARGMFNKDASQRQTARFTGIEFVPSTITVRSAGEKASHLSPVSVNEARYNDFVPLIYGTAWCTPRIVFARNDGNLTRMEVLLGMGRIQNVYKVLVNDIDIPAGRSGLNMTGTGWFNVVTSGTRSGAFNGDFTDKSGKPLGDPYGSMAYLSVVVPNRINDGQSLPSIKVLVDGLQLPTYAADGSALSERFTNNPSWIILDILRRSGWSLEELDLPTFAAAAVYCDEPISTVDLNGNPSTVARFQCNLALANRRSVADVLRGVRSSARLYLTFGFNGLLQLRIENTIALQQPTKPANSNSVVILDGGWPAYEFGDGTDGTTGILRNPDGSSSVRLWSRSSADSPNRLSVEFQDAFNEYQQDSYSLVDADDVGLIGQEISSTLSALGIANLDQAARILQFTLEKSLRGNVFIEFQTSVKSLGLSLGDIIAITYLKEGLERQPFRIVKLAPSQNHRSTTITAQIHRDEWYSDSTTRGNSGGRRQAGFGMGLPRPISGTIANHQGGLDFDVSESSTESIDGTTTLSVTVGFSTPALVSDSAPGIPLISLVPGAQSAGGSLSGGATYYYAVSSVDVDGHESGLSFVVRAAVLAGSDLNTVSLTGLSFPSSAVSFHVYRGSSPNQLLRIRANAPLSTTFLDSGLPALAELPPDPNFDHTNLYWRLELQPEASVVTHSESSVGNAALRMITNEYRGTTVRITRGQGAGQERIIAANTDTTLTTTRAWDLEPDTTSHFVVAQSGFQFGATGKSNRVQFEIPNRAGAVIEISGRSANSNDVECPYELSPLTRWLIGGAGLKTVDLDTPPAPVFGLSLSSTLGGTIDLGAVGFPDFSNTSSVTAGTYTFHVFDEASGPSTVTAAAAIGLDDTMVSLSGGINVIAGSYIQFEGEILQVSSVSSDGTQIGVARAALGSNGATHTAGTPCYVLTSRVTIVPFVRNFFGSPASGSWSYPVSMPNVRIAAVEMFVSNSQGNSPPSVGSFTNTLDRGLRTLSGGQYSFQVAGFLAIQTGAAPDLSIETDRVVRDIFGFVKTAPTDANVQANISVNGSFYCAVIIAAGATSSNSVSGLTLPVLRSQDRMSIDLVSVGDTVPGADLTVVIRV